MLALLAALAVAAEVRVPTVPELLVRAEPDTSARVIGRLVQGSPVEVFERRPGEPCPVEGWGRVGEVGWACLDHTAPSEEVPVALPRLVAYPWPGPEDYDGYQETGAWAHGESEALLPFVYARRWRRWEGHTWPSVEAWLAGEAPTGRLPQGRRARFVDVVETERGVVFVRPDGSVVPEEEVFVFPVTRLVGRDLVASPVPEGLTVGWVVGYEGASVFPGPAADGAPLAVLAYHAQILVRAGPTGWWEVPDALGAGVSGWARASEVRAWVPAARPDGVADDALWIDVDLAQDTLALVRGDRAAYATLVSPGVGGRYRTPTGTFAITDKAAWWDMASLPGAEDVYYVEAVPWTMHFSPRYALHGAYWHWGFGHRVSHGCVNLAPRDAAVIFDAVHPVLPTGWHSVIATEADPGTVIRIR